MTDNRRSCGLFRGAVRRMLRSMSASRFRLGAVLGINQTLSWGMTFYLPAIVAAPVEASLGQSGFRILGAFSWALLVAGACAPRVGKWIDRHGGRGALLASVVTIAVGQVVLAATPDLAVWYLGWTIIGVGMAMGLYDAAFATVGGLLGREAGPSITGDHPGGGVREQRVLDAWRGADRRAGLARPAAGLRRPDAAGQPADGLAAGAARTASAASGRRRPAMRQDRRRSGGRRCC